MATWIIGIGIIYLSFTMFILFRHFREEMDQFQREAAANKIADMDLQNEAYQTNPMV